MTATIKDILGEVEAERTEQLTKWGNDLDDSTNTPWMWAAYIGQYATKWMRGTFVPLPTDTVSAFRTCMIKVAALAVAAIESIDRQREINGGTFYEG